MTSFVVGVGRTKFGKLSQGLEEIFYESMFNAITDSPLNMQDLDAVFVTNCLAGSFQSQLHISALISELLPETQLPVVQIDSACASGGTAIHQAVISNYKKVMVVGAEKMSSVTVQTATQTIAMAGNVKERKEGLTMPLAYATIASHHFDKYGTTHEDLELVSLKNHSNANLNPLSQFYHKKVSETDVREAPEINPPLTLYDCSPLSDGGAAIVISSKRISDRDVEIIGTGIGTGPASLSGRKSLTSLEPVKIAAKHAFKQAGLTAENVDFAEVHDCFTIAELLAMEDLGFCTPGESKDLVKEGVTSLKGNLPINPSGGLKANGHPVGATGIAQVYEVVTQLRGEAGKRQVSRANIGLSHNVGGIGASAAVTILRRT